MSPAVQPTDPVAELYAAVRKWTEHIPVNLPYVDLMFAFGYATLGDRARARSLVEDARKVMEVPAPTELRNTNQFEATVSAVTTDFLFKAFRYRIEQALAGKQHGGPLADDVLAELGQITHRSRGGGTNNAYLRAEYVIGRARENSQILEPQERPDIYDFWTKNQDALKRELVTLGQLRDPGELTARFRNLWRDGVAHKELQEVRFLLLHKALPLAPRAGEAFTVELIGLVPEVLGSLSDAPDVPRKQGELLERALFLAGHYDRGELVKTLVDSFVALVHNSPEDVRCRLVNVVAGQCLHSLKKLGMRDEIDRLLGSLHEEVTGGAVLAELRTKHATQPEVWASVLQTLLNLAAGWLTFGHQDRAAPILDAARFELLDPAAVRIPPKEYTALAQTYVFALGQGPSVSGFSCITELFRLMDRRKITNTWTTAQYYSRFHLNLVESAVFAFAATQGEPSHVVSG